MAETLIREHRGSLAESMKTVRPVRDRDHLIEIICDSLAPDFLIQPEQIRVEPYGGLDTRIGWNTHLISIDGYGVWGMANGPL
jgi:hypothetical protein